MIEQLKKSWRERDDEGGFTLIELLVVIVILGILAAVVVFAVAGIQDRGQDSACAADEKTLTIAQEAFYASREGSPTYAANQAALVTAGLLNSASTLYTTTGTATSFTVEPVAAGPCDS